jgi:hypothetical protein
MKNGHLGGFATKAIFRPGITLGMAIESRRFLVFSGTTVTAREPSACGIVEHVLLTNSSTATVRSWGTETAAVVGLNAWAAGSLIGSVVVRF